MMIVSGVVFGHFKSKEFVGPIAVELKAANNKGYIGKAKLEPGVRYGVVVAAVFHRKYRPDYAKGPQIWIDGNERELIGGSSVVGNNVELDFDWVESHVVHYIRRYFGSFSIDDPCECVVEIKGHTQAFLENYQLTLYKDIDESYFWLGGIAVLCTAFFVLTGVACVIFLMGRRFKLALVEFKNMLIGQFKNKT